MAHSQRPVRLPVVVRDQPVEPRLDAIEQLSDRCGIMQHSVFSIPDRSHGYCVDDNARALILMHRLGAARSVRSEELATIFAAFVQHAWNGSDGVFRNFMGYDRGWLERVGSQDSFGRALWSVGVTVDEAKQHDLRRWACHLFDDVVPHALKLDCLRSGAFALLGAVSVLRANAGHDGARQIVELFGGRLYEALVETRRADWCWFEPVLAYDNARLPEALLLAGDMMNDRAMVDAALDAFDWLDGVQSSRSGHFRAVGSESFGRHYAPPRPFDQQPLEAWATIDAAITAFAVTADERWRDTAMKAWRWYLGDNDLGLPMASLSGGSCFDGLMSDGINLNTGAESVLSFQLSCCSIARLSGTVTRTAHSQTGAVAV